MQNEHRVKFQWHRHVECVRQTEASECGAACLVMIANYYGNGIDLPSMRRETSASGATLSKLIRQAEGLGLACRALRLEISELHHLKLPCIAHTGSNHFVVLTRVSRTRVHLEDPSSGPVSYSLRAFGAIFSGVALELTPNSSFVKQPKPPALSVWRMFFAARGVGTALTAILVISAILELIVLAIPLLTQIVVDRVIGRGETQFLAAVAIALSFLVLTQAITTGVRAWASAVLSFSLNYEWTSRTFTHLLRLPQQYFERRHLGDISSRFKSLDAIQQSLASKSIEVVLDGIMACLGFAMMMYYSSTLSLLSLAACAIAILSRAASYRAMRDSNTNVIASEAKQESAFLESVRGQTEIKLHNGVPYMASRFQTRTIETNNANAKMHALQIAFGSANSAVFGIFRMATIVIGARLALSGSLTAGMLIAFLTYSDQFNGRVLNFFDFALQLKLLRVHSQRVADIALSQQESHQRGEAGATVTDSSITLRNIAYRYSRNEPWVVKNCDLHVEAGQTVAIIGPSGCGKTTLLKILAGLVAPEEGSICVGGQPLERVGKDVHRSLMSVVMQESMLFAGTIAENVSFFDPDHSPERVQRSCAIAGIHDDIAKMPMRYETRVGDMGSTLSGGQRQRIALARALYREPQIILMDEATSHLDIPREKEIVAQLKAMRITRVIVSHRPESVAIADRLFAMEEGKLREIQASPVTAHA